VKTERIQPPGAAEKLPTLYPISKTELFARVQKSQ
jgi:hypothetical protein